jgi:hypothetical protein
VEAAIVLGLDARTLQQRVESRPRQLTASLERLPEHGWLRAGYRQLAALQAKLADLKGAYDRQDYKTVMAGAPAVLSEAQGLLGATMLKKETVVKAATEEWPGLAASVPGMLTAVTKRANQLGKSSHPPAGVDMAAAKSAVDDATLAWTKAQAANTASDPEAAVASAHEAKAKVAAAAAAMKMTLPAAPAAK